MNPEVKLEQQKKISAAVSWTKLRILTEREKPFLFLDILFSIVITPKKIDIDDKNYKKKFG